ncbi:MAG: hypothetical protein P1U86_20135 [Verrucomicrobiales bacterium]|nr:hypothetical protein [Verrucomicrobiales bacterium]
MSRFYCPFRAGINTGTKFRWFRCAPHTGWYSEEPPAQAWSVPGAWISVLCSPVSVSSDAGLELTGVVGSAGGA